MFDIGTPEPSGASTPVPQPPLPPPSSDDPASIPLPLSPKEDKSTELPELGSTVIEPKVAPVTEADPSEENRALEAKLTALQAKYDREYSSAPSSPSPRASPDP